MLIDIVYTSYQAKVGWGMRESIQTFYCHYFLSEEPPFSMRLIFILTNHLVCNILCFMKTEKRVKAKTLVELGEQTIDLDKIKKLREGFESILNEKGKEQGGLMFGTKMIYFSDTLEIPREASEAVKIKVFVFRQKSQYPLKKEMIMDIGMCSEEGDRVRLVIQPNGDVGWGYLERSMWSDQKRGMPSVRDIGLHLEVLELLQDSE